MYYTNPNNFRPLFDSLDRYGTAIAGLTATTGVATVGAICTVGTAGICGAPAAAATAVAISTIGGAAVTSFAAASLNSGATKGFKQHILEDGDEGHVTTITLKSDGTVVSHSPSGDSSTVYSSKNPPPLTEKQRKEIESLVAEKLTQHNRLAGAYHT